ncbi:MAG TPA: nitrate reductase associated protein, partial [Polyangiales bacterium]|nr:nitrate reductase associated protein [Polyangiales bacterium]
MPTETHLPLYRFDQADAQLSLLPMAARRALDCAGLHLSLKGWQTLTLERRQALVRLGGAEQIDR